MKTREQLIEETRDLTEEEVDAALKKAWVDNGQCRTCGWFSAYYEVVDHLEPNEDDFSEWLAPCLSPEAYESGEHKGSFIYPEFKKLDSNQASPEKKEIP